MSLIACNKTTFTKRDGPFKVIFLFKKYDLSFNE